eukprot:1593353-Prymnesium_polylepis.1
MARATYTPSHASAHISALGLSCSCVALHSIKKHPHKCKGETGEACAAPNHVSILWSRSVACPPVSSLPRSAAHDPVPCAVCPRSPLCV